MGTGDRSPPGRNRRANHPINFEPSQPDAGPNDIHDRVHRSYLVEVNALDWGAVNLGLRLTQSAKNARGLSLHLGVESALIDQGENVVQMTVGLLYVLIQLHIDLRGGESLLLDPCGVKSIALDRQAFQIGPQIVEAQSRIQQGAQNHVATGPAETVEIRNVVSHNDGKDTPAGSSRRPSASLHLE